MTGNVFCRLLTLSLFLIFATNAYGQTPVVTDVTDQLQTWVKHLDGDFNKYYTHEKSAQLKESLSLLKLDLGDYMKARKRLSDSLFRNNAAPGKKDPENLEALKLKMNEVMRRMREVTDLTNEELRKEGDKLNDAIYNTLYTQPNQYLSHLEAFLAGFEVTKKDLALDGSTCYTRLQNCISLISGLEGKIDRKK